MYVRVSVFMWGCEYFLLMWVCVWLAYCLWLIQRFCWLLIFHDFRSIKLSHTHSTHQYQLTRTYTCSQGTTHTFVVSYFWYLNGFSFFYFFLIHFLWVVLFALYFRFSFVFFFSFFLGIVCFLCVWKSLCCSCCCCFPNRYYYICICTCTFYIYISLLSMNEQWLKVLNST